MPEGHTIHRLARDQRRDLVGHRLEVDAAQARFAEAAGRVLERTEAYGKNLFHHWDGGEVVHIHLGLVGGFRRHPVPAPPMGPAVRLRLTGPDAAWDLSGAMTCALVDPARRDEVVAALGPDPLRPDGRVDDFVARITASSRGLGALLLDQSIVAGIGNVYRAEVLFLLGLHPLVTGTELGADRAVELWTILTRLLRDGVRRNRIVTRDPADLPGPLRSLEREDVVYVYRRSTCGRCGAPLEVFEAGGRKIWACPVEQPEPSPPGSRPDR
jgi:endonuclease-8